MRSWFEPEPELNFGKGNRHIDPKAGLAMYGPFIAEGQSQNKTNSINLAIIGPSDAVSLVDIWLRELNQYRKAGPGDSILFPFFPGFENVFRTHINMPTALRQIIPEKDIKEVIEIKEDTGRVEGAAKLYTTRLDHLDSIEPTADVVICAIPKEIEDYCWSSHTHKVTKEKKNEERIKKRLREAGQLFLTDFDEDVVPIVKAPKRGTNFRARIKAYAMDRGIVTQLVRETTLSGERTVQPLGTLAWNFAVGLYYKAGGYPWRLAKVREKTCFVGISFYKENSEKPNRIGTSIAQIFDSTGEGLIIKGGSVVLDEGDDWNSPHMTSEIASTLGRKLLGAYKDRNEQTPDRIVFHKSSRFWPEEISGLERSLNGQIKTDFVAIEQGDFRLIREGAYPPLRGTCLGLKEREYLVYSMGYIPYLGTYPGPHVPSPLQILEHIGDSTSQEICSEILALTKLNWNTAQFCCGIPITLNISKRVSSIIVEVEDESRVRPSSRFYM
jgi:hypothetical protein